MGYTTWFLFEDEARLAWSLRCGGHGRVKANESLSVPSVWLMRLDWLWALGYRCFSGFCCSFSLIFCFGPCFRKCISSLCYFLFLYWVPTMALIACWAQINTNAGSLLFTLISCSYLLLHVLRGKFSSCFLRHLVQMYKDCLKEGKGGVRYWPVHPYWFVGIFGQLLLLVLYSTHSGLLVICLNGYLDDISWNLRMSQA